MSSLRLGQLTQKSKCFASATEQSLDICFLNRETFSNLFKAQPVEWPTFKSEKSSKQATQFSRSFLHFYFGRPTALQSQTISRPRSLYFSPRRRKRRGSSQVWGIGSTSSDHCCSTPAFGYEWGTCLAALPARSRIHYCISRLSVCWGCCCPAYLSRISASSAEILARDVACNVST